MDAGQLVTIISHYCLFACAPQILVGNLTNDGLLVDELDGTTASGLTQNYRQEADRDRQRKRGECHFGFECMAARNLFCIVLWHYIQIQSYTWHYSSSSSQCPKTGSCKHSEDLAHHCTRGPAINLGQY